MNRTARLLSVFMVVLLFLYAFIGSGKQIREVNTGTTGASWLGRSGNLTVWYTDDRLSPFISKAAVEFGEKENITVIPVLKPAENFLEECYKASASGESFPDVIITGSETLEKAYLSGLAMEIPNEGMTIGILNYSEAAVNAVTYQGMTLGYPLSFDTSVMVYNRTYLEGWARQMAIADLTGNHIDMEGGS
ncbi:MAG: hypothetical protein J6U41_05635, partial [Lachnospiraceae bacterium]|nr:hypothetical protein [Lachnospiraceae bacterium]